MKKLIQIGEDWFNIDQIVCIEKDGDGYILYTSNTFCHIELNEKQFQIIKRLMNKT